MGDELSIPLGTAMYDLMGQAAGVPAYKLFGQKHRSWVPVGSWTVSTHPDRMAEAVEQYSSQGYTWMKYHLSPFENVFDQTEAMQRVAPPGFKIHYDFTGGGTDDHRHHGLGLDCFVQAVGEGFPPVEEGGIVLLEGSQAAIRARTYLARLTQLNRWEYLQRLQRGEFGGQPLDH